MKKALLSLAALTVLVAACKKNDDNQPAAQRIVGSWMMTANQTVITTNGQSGQAADSFNNQSACTKDDLYNFAANGAFSHTEGATKCRNADPDTIERSTYALASNDSKLIFAPGTSYADTLDVVELSGSTLRVKSDVTFTNGNITVIYSSQQSFSKK